MKSSTFMFILMVYILIANRTLAQSRVSVNQLSNVVVAEEVSLVLLSPAYSQLTGKLNAITSQSNNVLRISGFNLVDLGLKKIVSFQLVMRQRNNSRSNWSLAGSIVAYIAKSSTGEIQVEGIFYKPEGSTPGGASVGN
ncbi:MAG: hypothetical protein J0M15_11775 [Deltaproteobacteria bacterium]|nr:hypothetical protein [Deltaproteobacteria bacterium]